MSEQIVAGVSAQLGRKLSKRGRAEGRPATSIINETARYFGITRQAVQRAVKIASLSPEAKATARAVGLDDNQSALMAAAREPTPAAQVATLKQHAEWKQKNGRRSTNTPCNYSNETLVELAQLARALASANDPDIVRQGLLDIAAALDAAAGDGPVTIEVDVRAAA